MKTFKFDLRAMIACSVLPAGLLMAGSPAFGSGSDTGALACTKAVRESVGVQTNAGNGVQLQHLHKGVMLTEAQYASGEYSYDLIAVHPVTGQIQVRATCTADDRGRVTGLRVDHPRP